MAPPPHLMPELIVDEILVRFLPDDPAFLVRASVVCRPWRRLLCDPAFCRRYVAFHRSPPLLGFLHNCRIHDHGKYYTAPRFMCTTTPSPVLPMKPFDDCNYGWRILDCRHGRVLFKAPEPVRRHRALFNDPEVNVMSAYLAVWDRATGEHKEVPKPPSPLLIHHTMAVLCAVSGCDHLDCHGGAFFIVYVGYNPMARVVQSHVYSSEASAWSSSSFVGPAAGYVTVSRPSVVIGNDIYFVLATRPVAKMAILNIDLGNNHFSFTNPPEAYDVEENAIIMATEDGSLGFAAILGSTLSLWSRDVMNSEVLGGWARRRVIELQTLIPFKNGIRVVSSAEGSGIIFVASDAGVFSLDLKSGHAKKLDEPKKDITVFPFMSFYTPDGSSCKLRLPMGHPDHIVE